MDGVSVNAEQFGGLSDRQIVLALLCALCAVLSHTGDTRSLGAGPKALSSLAALIAYKRSVSDQRYAPWYRITSTGWLSARFIFFKQTFYFSVHVNGLHEVV